MAKKTSTKGKAIKIKKSVVKEEDIRKRAQKIFEERTKKGIDGDEKSDRKGERARLGCHRQATRTNRTLQPEGAIPAAHRPSFRLPCGPRPAPPKREFSLGGQSRSRRSS